MGLAAYWVVALSVAWVGGSPWTYLGGGIAATCGHGFSWYRRRRSLGVWPAVMALMVVGLAFLMRTEILAAFDGNWLPLAHFLLLVQASASFDIRTRGGLYAGLALSAIVLFFASQQAFELSFGIFLLGYAALLMAFLATAYLEDETAETTERPDRGGMPLVWFWWGSCRRCWCFRWRLSCCCPGATVAPWDIRRWRPCPLPETPSFPRPLWNSRSYLRGGAPVRVRRGLTACGDRRLQRAGERRS